MNKMKKQKKKNKYSNTTRLTLSRFVSIYVQKKKKFWNITGLLLYTSQI